MKVYIVAIGENYEGLQEIRKVFLSKDKAESFVNEVENSGELMECDYIELIEMEVEE